MYAQDKFQIASAADAERRAALRVHDDARGYLRPRFGADQSDATGRRRSGQLYQNPTYKNISPRVGVRVGRVRDGPHRGPRRLRAVLQHQQSAEPDRHGDQSAGHPARRSSPTRRSRRRRSSAASAISIRPVQWDLENPRVHVCNVNVQRELWRNIVMTAGYAGSRGIAPVAQRRRQHRHAGRRSADGTLFFPAGAPRPNTASPRSS